MTQCRHLYNEFAWNCFMTSVEKRNLMKDNAILKKKPRRLDIVDNYPLAKLVAVRVVVVVGQSNA